MNCGMEFCQRHILIDPAKKEVGSKFLTFSLTAILGKLARNFPQVLGRFQYAQG